MKFFSILILIVLVNYLSLNAQNVKTILYHNEGQYLRIKGDTAFYELYVYDLTKYFLTEDTLFKQENGLFKGKIVFAKLESNCFVLKNISGEKFKQKHKPSDIVMNKLDDKQVAEYYKNKMKGYFYYNTNDVFTTISNIKNRGKCSQLAGEYHKIGYIPYFNTNSIENENSYEEYLKLINEFRHKVNIESKN